MVPAKGSCTPIVAVSSGHTRANSSSICRRAGRSTPRLRRLRLRYGSISSPHHAAITAEARGSWSCEKLRDRAALLRDGHASRGEERERLPRPGLPARPPGPRDAARGSRRGGPPEKKV